LAFGLLVAGSVHMVKSAAVRPLVTAATGGMGNLPVSIAEDLTATAVSILSIIVPIVMGVVLIILLSLVLWWWSKPKENVQPA